MHMSSWNFVFHAMPHSPFGQKKIELKYFSKHELNQLISTCVRTIFRTFLFCSEDIHNTEFMRLTTSKIPVVIVSFLTLQIFVYKWISRYFVSNECLFGLMYINVPKAGCTKKHLTIPRKGDSPT